MYFKTSTCNIDAAKLEKQSDTPKSRVNSAFALVDLQIRCFSLLALQKYKSEAAESGALMKRIVTRAWQPAKV